MAAASWSVRPVGDEAEEEAGHAGEDAVASGQVSSEVLTFHPRFPAVELFQ
jgi:hypothetical protein